MALPAGRPSRKSRLFSWRFSFADLLHIVAILAITYVVWGLAHDRLLPSSWSTPMEYAGDSHQIPDLAAGGFRTRLYPVPQPDQFPVGCALHCQLE